MQSILVTGGAGALGRLVVKQLSAAGYPVRGMSRRARPGDDWPGAEWAQADLETGAGLTEAVQGIDVVVHAATGSARHAWQQLGAAEPLVVIGKPGPCPSPDPYPFWAGASVKPRNEPTTDKTCHPLCPILLPW